MTCRTDSATESTSPVRCTTFTFTSSATRSTNGSRSSASWPAKVSDVSGNRTRRPLALRMLSAAEQTSRTRSIPATRSGSAGRTSAVGQLVRWTLRSPLRCW